MNGLENSPRQPLFPLGRLLITPNALSQLQQHDITAALRRHTTGDWAYILMIGSYLTWLVVTLRSYRWLWHSRQ